jgi:hypothetical protein
MLIINTLVTLEVQMARVLEEVLIIKLSKMVKDSSKDESVISAEQRALIEQTIPTLIEEVLDNDSVVVEVAELD